MQVFTDASLTLTRRAHGLIHVKAASEDDLYRGMGFAHGVDRGIQLLLMRLLGRGRMAECIEGTDEMVEVDRFFRRMGWAHDAEAEVTKLSDAATAACAAYAKGINDAFARRTPWEFRLLGYRPEPWTIADSVIIVRMTGYLTLAQSQGEIERLFVELVQAGVPDAHLEALFPGRLEGFDRGLLERVQLGERIVPESVRASFGPRMMASNNWVTAPRKNASGAAMLANDPHLEVNRLPAVWHEMTLDCAGRRAVTATMPGIPGLLLARTDDLSWGATYTFMDAIDSWVEDCKDGKYRRADTWVPFRQRKEVIKRKKKTPVEATFYENDHGVLDGDPHREGLFLSSRWSGAGSGVASLEAIVNMWGAKTVQDAMEIMGTVEPSFSWVLADSSGNIGYQMSGLMPKRKAGWEGFVPLPGWDEENDWQGFVDPRDLPRRVNPDCGFIVTANDDLNDWGTASPINMPMASHRADRIRDELASGSSFTVEQMSRLQNDVLSRQALAFMEVLRDLLPDDERATVLKAWNGHYDAESTGASAFEAFYAALRQEVFGDSLSPVVVEHLANESGIFADFYANFDDILLSETSVWFGERSREELFRAAFAASKKVPICPWKDRQQFVQSHVLFGGKLPRFLGFDRGPFPMIGGRATVHQGQLYRSGGRATSFAPSIRIVADFGEKGWHSVLAGGPSDRRFSPWYNSEMQAWLSGKTKKVEPASD